MHQARLGLIVTGLVAIGFGAWTQGCLFAPNDCDDLLKCNGSGAGGAGSGMVASAVEASSAGGASAATGSSSSTGGMPCTTVAQCPGTSTLCGQVTCVDGVCGFQTLQPDGPSFSQIYGDCHVVTCKDGQLGNNVDSNDLYDDGNECTLEACNDGGLSSTVQVGSTCGTANQCVSGGACVECSGDGNCTESATPKCQGNHCVPLMCANTLKDPGETDVDCGGLACARCEDGKLCDQPMDCVSAVCSVKVGEVLKTCHHACTDGVKNGTETGVDCGGPACPARCSPGGGCVAPDDCKGGVCQGGLCQTPTCTDGVKNGTEMGVDCGTGCPHPCPDN
jgi:hypothetical protein